MASIPTQNSYATPIAAKLTALGKKWSRRYRLPKITVELQAPAGTNYTGIHAKVRGVLAG